MVAGPDLLSWQAWRRLASDATRLPYFQQVDQVYQNWFIRPMARQGDWAKELKKRHVGGISPGWRTLESQGAAKGRTRALSFLGRLGMEL
jgi:hypothetical protein